MGDYRIKKHLRNYENWTSKILSKSTIKASSIKKIDKGIRFFE